MKKVLNYIKEAIVLKMRLNSLTVSSAWSYEVKKPAELDKYLKSID
ncbi:hypothetical protein ACPBEH_09920 [Latilactobacillus sp. 5-91]|nr:hypothetical protein [Latilactobacillus sakei]